MIRIEERATVKLPGETSLFVSFDFNKTIVDELKILENTFYNPEEKEWEIPLTGLSEFIDRTCRIDDIDIRLLAESKQSPTTYDLMPYKTTPFDYQEEGIQFGLNHTTWLLLDAPGLGKTLQLTYLAQELKERYGIQHCLIVCGINTLKTNWKTEIEKHSDLSARILGQRVTRTGKLVIGGIPERLQQLKEPIDEFFVITNIETLRDDNILKALNKNKPNKFDMVVVDEIHCCKSPTSTQGRNLLKLTKATYRVGATGTLFLNNPLDVYVPLKWIGADRSTYSNFKYYYCNYGGPFGNMLMGFKNLDILKHQLSNCSLRRTKDILKLPPKTVINEYVDMSDSQSIFYNNIKNGIVSQVDKVHMSTASILAMVSRLRQATVLPSILTTESVPSAKIDRCVDLVEQIVSSGDKVVIFSVFKDPCYELLKRLDKYNPVIGTGDQSDIEIEQAKNEFQTNSSKKVFIGTSQKCGTGITLTAASYMIFLDTAWTAGVFEQNQDRIHRIGTNNSVFIYNLITRDTIDERVLEIVNDKRFLGDYVIDDEAPPEAIDSLRKYLDELI